MDVSLYIKVANSMSSFLSSLYRLEIPLIGFSEQLLILNGQ